MVNTSNCLIAYAIAISVINTSVVYAKEDEVELSYQLVAKAMTLDLSKNITGYGEFNIIFVNDRSLGSTLSYWQGMFENSLKQCDEIALYYNNKNIKKACYRDYWKSYDLWIEASKDKSISMSVWNAGARDSFICLSPSISTVNFDNWLGKIRVYKEKEAEYLRTKPYYDARNAIVRRLTVVRNEMWAEERKFFKNKAKLADLTTKEAAISQELFIFDSKYSERR